MSLIRDVAQLNGPKWNDNRTHWRDLEGYDLAVGPKTGGRLFPKSDERPDKVRKLGQITRGEVASELYSFDAQEDGEAQRNASSMLVEDNDLKDVYGDKCYLAVYTTQPRRDLVLEDQLLEWFDFLPAFVGMRRSTAQKYGESVKELRLKKRRPPYGARKKHNWTQDKRWCDMHV